MPTYEYRCPSCGHEFERFSPKITDSSTVRCPQCDGTAHRLISGGAGLLFKGSGFYTTDYRSDSYRDAEKKEGKATGEGADEAGGRPSEKEPKSKKDPE